MGLRETRHWVHGLFEVGAGGRLGWYVDYCIASLIVVNVVAVSLETVDPLYREYGRAFYGIEIVSVAVFSVEYLGRLWSATEHEEYRDPVWGRFYHAMSPFMIVDLLAILPFFLGALVDLRFLRALRLLRFLRLLKLTRYSASIMLFLTAIRLKRQELFISSIVGIILLMVSSSAMYFAEHTAQPEEFSSIPAAVWWGVITLTTVGYGDVTPVTPVGKVIGVFVAVLGVGTFALPASILASGFIEAARGNLVRCPHCDRELLEEHVEAILE